MKKASAKRGSSTMSNPPPKDVDEYLSTVPEPARSTLKKTRATIRAAVPADATEAISYRIPTVRYKGGLVAYAAFTNHCSLFPMSMAVIRKLSKELKPYLASKGTIHFPLDQPLPPALLKKIVKARLAEKMQKQKGTARPR